jgi:hypothetical protein
MATLKAVILKDQVNKKGESNIKILIVHKGVTKYIKTDHYVKPDFMMPSGKVNKKCPNSELINTELNAKIIEYQRKIIKLGDDIKRLNSTQIKEYLTQENLEQIDFFEFAKRHIQYLKENKKKTWKMRTIFLAALDELNKEGMDPVITTNPWRKFKIKSEETKKRNIDIVLLRQIRDFQTKDEYMAIARDMFMLTFYLIGINTIDLFWSKGIENGRINYTRAKTASKNARMYSIKVEPEALELIEKYKGEKYLLMFADNNKLERKIEDSTYHVNGKELTRMKRGKWSYADDRAFRIMINDFLDKVVKELNLNEKITTYWARHSWATIAWNNCEIPEGIISVCLGHDETGNPTTPIYIEKRNKVIDDANRKVLDELKKPPVKEA